MILAATRFALERDLLVPFADALPASRGLSDERTHVHALVEREGFITSNEVWARLHLSRHAAAEARRRAKRWV